MKRNKPTELTPIEFHPTDSFIHYFIEPNSDKASDFLRKRGHKKFADHTEGNGLTILYEGEDPIVWLRHKRPDTVAHEMIHAVMHMLRNLNIRQIDKSNEELFAYFVDYAVKQVLN